MGKYYFLLPNKFFHVVLLALLTHFFEKTRLENYNIEKNVFSRTIYL